MTLTQEQKEKYVANPTRCPFCKSTLLWAFSLYDAGALIAAREVLCHDCGRTWTESYRLCYIDETTEEES